MHPLITGSWEGRALSPAPRAVSTAAAASCLSCHTHNWCCHEQVLEVRWVYRALAQGVIRSGPSMDSEKAGKLAEGETITVSERQDVPGTMRVRFEKGWASVTSKKGTPLLEEGAVRLRTAKGWVSHQAP